MLGLQYLNMNYELRSFLEGIPKTLRRGLECLSALTDGTPRRLRTLARVFLYVAMASREDYYHGPSAFYGELRTILRDTRSHPEKLPICARVVILSSDGLIMVYFIALFLMNIQINIHINFLNIYIHI